jgi:hypothetical protein
MNLHSSDLAICTKHAANIDRVLVKQTKFAGATRVKGDSTRRIILRKK